MNRQIINGLVKLFLKEIKRKMKKRQIFNIGAKYIQRRAQIKQQPKKTSWKEKGFRRRAKIKVAPENFCLTKVFFGK
jgi:hypothetical protein